MADKTYKMTVTLSNGDRLNAGTFVAPQGPRGPQGPSGALPAPTYGDGETTLENGVYLVRPESTGCWGLLTVPGDASATGNIDAIYGNADGGIDIHVIFAQGHSLGKPVFMHISATGAVSFTQENEVPPFQYVKISETL